MANVNMGMKWPSDNRVRYALFYGTFAFALRFWLEANRREGLDGDVGMFVALNLGVYLFGAAWSGTKIVAGLAATVFAVGAWLVLRRGEEAAKRATNCAAFYLLLSLYALWIEPWMSPSGVTINVGLMLLKAPMMVVDVVVSLFWFGSVLLLETSLQRELD